MMPAKLILYFIALKIISFFNISMAFYIMCDIISIIWGIVRQSADTITVNRQSADRQSAEYIKSGQNYDKIAQ